MELLNHGGQCCGIKHIKGMGYYDPGDPANPGDWYYCPSKKAESHPDDRDVNGSHVSSDTPFFTDDAPKESYLERLDRYLAFCRKWRPQGCIEITLISGQKQNWHKYLIERGFQNYVPKFKNSNSGNWVYIYHLVYDAKAEAKKAAPETVSPSNPFNMEN